MHKSMRWTAPLRWAVLAAVMGLLLVPGRTGLASPMDRPLQQTGARDQIVYLDGGGQLLVARWQNSTLNTVWQSGTGSEDTGWTNFVTGDFNDDGKDEIVATRGSRIQAYNPVLGANPVTFRDDLNYPQTFHRLAVGDFLHKGYDQVAASYTTSGSSGQREDVLIYDLVNNRRRFIVSLDWTVQAMAGGNINRDDWDDLVILRRGGDKDTRWFVILSGEGLAADTPRASYLFREGQYGDDWGDWRDVVVGDVDKDVTNGTADHPGDEIVSARDAGAGYEQVLVSWYSTSSDTLKDFSGLDYEFTPPFTSLALADMDNDSRHDMEIVALRDPDNDSRPYITVLNPSGPQDIPTFEPNGESGIYAFDKVAAGDIDGDGEAEVAVVRDISLRVFYRPMDDEEYVDIRGSFRPTALAIADLGFGTSTLQVSPGSLQFNFAASEYFASKSQTLQVTTAGSGNLSWQAALSGQTGAGGQQWLFISSTSGSTPASVSVSVNPQAVGVGTREGRVIFRAFSGSSQIATLEVPVRATVADPGFIVNPAQAVFLHGRNGPTYPARVQVSVQRPTGSPVNFTVTAVSSTSAAGFEELLRKGAVEFAADGIKIDGVVAATPDWLQVNPQSGTTPAVVTLSVNDAVANGLPLGVQHAFLVFRSEPFDPAKQQWVSVVDVQLSVSNNVYKMVLPSLL